MAIRKSTDMKARSSDMVITLRVTDPIHGSAEHAVAEDDGNFLRCAHVQRSARRPKIGEAASLMAVHTVGSASVRGRGH